MTNIRIGLDTTKHVFPLPSLLAGGIYFFGRLARKAPGRRSMRGPRAAYSVIREGCEVARRNGSTVALVLVPDC